MRGSPGETYLTGQQVAEICHTNEATIHYFARTRMLQGRRFGNSWHFRLSDAVNFCEDWRYEQSRRWRAATGGNRFRSGLKRIGSFGLSLLNIASGGVSLFTAAGFDRRQLETWVRDWLGTVIDARAAAAQAVPQINDSAFQVVLSEGYRREAVVLAALNFLGPLLHFLRRRLRRPSQADLIDGQRVDPAAVSWHLNCWAVPLVRGFQVACVIATVAFVATVPPVPADPHSDTVIVPTRTPIPTPQPEPSPTPVATTEIFRPPTITPAISFVTPPPFVPPTATTEPPTATTEPPTATSFVPPSATSESGPVFDFGDEPAVATIATELAPTEAPIVQ